MKIRKICAVCKRLKWFKEKNKDEEKGAVCQQCRNMMTHIKNKNPETFTKKPLNKTDTL